MFPSGNSINPFFHFSSSIFFPSLPFLPQNENNIIFPPQQNHEISENLKNTAKRKDRHSKIYTAHGLRDRRVRLSIDIARKFFKLQDILGFDKASQTIRWLLKKSESSIKELNQKHYLNQDGFENISPISELSEGNGGISLRNTLVKTKEKRINRQSSPSFYDLRRESRDRARARARERTREKIMCIQKIDELNHSIPSRSSILVSEIEACEGIVGEVIKGSPSSPRSENPLTTQKDWDKNLFTEFEVFSKYFEACNH